MSLQIFHDDIPFLSNQIRTKCFDICNNGVCEPKSGVIVIFDVLRARFSMDSTLQWN